MEKEAAELLVRTAALEAVREFEKSQKKSRKVKVFQNAKKLMENYNRICKSVQEGVSELSDVDDGEELEELSAEDIYINSIIKSKLRRDPSDQDIEDDGFMGAMNSGAAEIWGDADE